jgi:formylglycine-generating enzyme required for sulfatase activity
MKRLPLLTTGFLLLVFCTFIGCDRSPSESGNANRNTVATVLKPKLVVDMGKGITMDFVLVRTGTFLMGSEKGEANERPIHKVVITKPFYLGKYEVTQEQWQSLMANNPSFVEGTKHPVESVSWNDCQEFLARLNAKLKQMKATLPTEAQWEYACRAGSTGEYCYGDGEANLGEYSWCATNSTGTTHPVGGKKPNAWGLYDMHGNVWEWCSDRYADNYYAESPAQDPTGPASGTNHVARSGSWYCVGYRNRSAFRLGFAADHKFTRRGLRVCLVFP